MNVTVKDSELVFGDVDTPAELNKVRALPSHRYDAPSGTWRAGHTIENWQAAKLLGLPLEGLPEPTSTGYAVLLRPDGRLAVKTPFSQRNVSLCQLIPDHHLYEGTTRTWVCKATPRNLAYLRATFDANWTPEALAVYDRLVTHPEAETNRLRQEKAGITTSDAEVTDYIFGGPEPFRHQRRAFLLSRDAEAFALFMEMGTGKTKVIIDTACWLWSRGKIWQVLVIAPNSVKTNWVTDEIPLHTPAHVPYLAAYYSAGANAEQRRQLDLVTRLTPDAVPDKLRWLVINVEAFSYPKDPTAGHRLAADFLAQAPTLLVVDESTRIKSPSAARALAITRLGRRAPFRRIVTGQPVTQGPLDLFQQVRFLEGKPHGVPGPILQCSAFYAFRNHYAIMGGWKNKQVVGYANLDDLQRRLDPYSYRITRDECLDLPDKIYEKRVVELSDRQRELYDQMRDEFRAELGMLGVVTAPIVLTQLLRLQQITGGFAPAERVLIAPNGQPYVDEVEIVPVSGTNPKLTALFEVVEEATGKVIVWARFRAEIAAVSAALRKAYGEDSVVEFHGGISDDGRISARSAFQEPSSPVRFFVGQTEAGGLGLTLTQAQTVIYFSNSFSYEARAQSEDRAHRIGQTRSVTYVDLVAEDTVDEKLLAALRAKNDLARLVTGDAWKAWL